VFLAKSFPWPRVLRRGSRHGLMLSLALLGLLLAPACGSRSGGIPVAPPPVVLSTNLPKQYPGQMLTLTGSGFTGADMVTIGGVQVSTFTLVDDRTITLTVPATVAAGEAAASAAPKPTLLVTDHDMPGLTGLELLQRCRVQVPGLKSISISGCLTHEMLDASGVKHDVVLTKPFNPQQLLSIVASLLPS